ncbi:MAG: hypothetical protein H6741_32860 [Alphaproteobacteria bacterium]|nr:hypothetical protein [Alphaproteobacteria bacterium]MCB9797507.1 hypothetical protein [Alphaproteobacteria bacterium]
MSNPYSAPESDLARRSGDDAGLGPITGAMVDSLERSRVWVILFAVFLAIGVVGMLFGAVFMVLGGAAAAFSGGDEGPFGGAMMIGMAFFYVVMAGLYVYPCWKLFQFAGSAGKIKHLGAQAFEEALEAQRQFWKFLGVGMLVMMGLYFVMIFAMFAFGLLGAAAL